MEGWLIFFGIVGGISLIAWVNSRLSDLQQRARKYGELKKSLEDYLKEKETLETLNRAQNRDLASLRTELELHKREAMRLQNMDSSFGQLQSGHTVLLGKLNSYEKGLDKKQQELERIRVDIENLAKEKSQGFPLLASAYEEYFRLQDSGLASHLTYKRHPAVKAAEDLRQMAKERRESEKAARQANYLLDYCKYLAPWLDDYIGLDSAELDEIIKEIHSSWEKKEKEFDEEVRRHYGPKYEGLTPSEKLQKKLDWYWNKPNKSNWQIGRDYERYIGYLFETKGWNVYYHGKKGFEDLGRDLICKKANAVEIIQCKRWAQEKIIHEKHIYYLFGTTVEYFLENFRDERLQLTLFPDLVHKRNVTPKLVTTIDVSAKAEQVAKVLGVVIEKVSSESYPSVKCNIARRTGEKIFHLPFDQQYDTALIEEERLERYVDTIAEAEALGFRHAYRWKGEPEQNTV